MVACAAAGVSCVCSRVNAGMGLHRVWSHKDKPPTSATAVLHDKMVEHVLKQIWVYGTALDMQ